MVHFCCEKDRKMSSFPLVSVCVPTYNFARFLPDCIESVRQQTLTDWELVICDDCSTDETAAVIRGYAIRDSRIRYVENEQRLGMNGNLKRAADSGTGRYLKILCADDWLVPGCLKTLCGLMEEYPRVVLATCAEINCNEAGVPLRVQFLFGKPISLISGESMLERMVRGEGFGGNSSFLIRTSAYRAVGGYDRTVHYAGDYDLAARLCRIGDYLHIDRPLFYGRSHPSSSSSQDPKKLLDVLDWFEIPEKIFQPRGLGNREWRRYQMLTGHLTAQYLLNIVLEHLRGHHAYAGALRKILLQHGNLLMGIPFLGLHTPRRLYNRLTGKHCPISIPPEPWMGSSSTRARVTASQKNCIR
jgi:glycosyltransferase involved in cell wall biosynthesis